MYYTYLLDFYEETDDYDLFDSFRVAEELSEVRIQRKG
jgi:hypothetical protein